MPQYNLAGLFKIARHGNKIYVHPQMIGLGRCSIYTQRNKKEQNHAICSNKDGTRDSRTK